MGLFWENWWFSFLSKEKHTRAARQVVQCVFCLRCVIGMLLEWQIIVPAILQSSYPSVYFQNKPHFIILYSACKKTIAFILTPLLLELLLTWMSLTLMNTDLPIDIDHFLEVILPSLNELLYWHFNVVAWECVVWVFLLTGWECEYMQYWWWFEREAEEISISQSHKQCCYRQ